MHREDSVGVAQDDIAGLQDENVAMFLVLTRDGKYFVTNDPSTAPNLLLAVGPETIGPGGQDLPEAVAATLAGKIGVNLEQPDTWPRRDAVEQLKAEHPGLQFTT